LISRVRPWEKGIKIHRIRSEESERNGIFVINVPKSNNPPHMHNGRYYQRLNYSTLPMTHQNVLRAFQTSWIQRRELYQNVIMPLYSEIKENCEKIERSEQGVTSAYENIIHMNRYLYDQTEFPLQQKIDEFYKGMKKLNSKLAWSERIGTRIINEELRKVFDEQRDFIEYHMKDNNLHATVRLRYPDGHIEETAGHGISYALFLRTTPKSYLQSSITHAEVIDYKLILHAQRDREITDEDFSEIWSKCLSKAEENDVYISIRNETPRLLRLGREILRFILAK